MMNSMNNYNLCELNQNDLRDIDGGNLLLAYHGVLMSIEALNEMYKDFKKGVEDGWNEL